MPRPVTARGLLLTVLGELVLPAQRPVWTASLLAVLADLGVSEKSARQAIMRTAGAGWMEPERAGRETRWHLSDTGHDLLAAGAHRIHEHAARARPWDGRWLVLLLAGRHDHRDTRHRLATRLSWVGLGSPAPGTWVTPHVSRRGSVTSVLGELDAHEGSWSFVTAPGGVGDDRALANAAWDLTELGRRYESFTRAFSGPRPRTDRAALVEQVRLVHAWRTFPGSDPVLPPQLGPPGWSRERAAEVFRDRHRAWSPRAHRAWEALGQEVEGTTRVGRSTSPG